MENGEYEQASNFFHRSALESPHFKTYELLGECYIHLKRFKEAIPFLAAASALNRGVRAPSLLSEAFLAISDHDQAAEAANVALSREPNNKTALRVKEATAETIQKRRDLLG